MRRIASVAVIVLAVALAVQPVLHRHSLVPETSAPPCSVCALGNAHVIAAPTLAAPLPLAYELPSVDESTTAAAELRTSSSRAPPQA